MEQARAQELAEGHRGYGAHFAQLIADGADVEGEARLADVLAPRGARILDAGSGMGRVGAALARRGHHVVAVDFDAEVIEQSRSTFPDLPVVTSRLDELRPDDLSADGHPTSYDLVGVGNVMVLLAPDTERTVLANLAALMTDDARLLVGFHLRDAPAPTARSFRSTSSPPTVLRSVSRWSTASPATTSGRSPPTATTSSRCCVAHRAMVRDRNGAASMAAMTYELSRARGVPAQRPRLRGGRDRTHAAQRGRDHHFPTDVVQRTGKLG